MGLYLDADPRDVWVAMMVLDLTPLVLTAARSSLSPFSLLCHRKKNENRLIPNVHNLGSERK